MPAKRNEIRTTDAAFVLRATQADGDRTDSIFTGSLDSHYHRLRLGTVLPVDRCAILCFAFMATPRYAVLSNMIWDTTWRAFAIYCDPTDGEDCTLNHALHLNQTASGLRA